MKEILDVAVVGGNIGRQHLDAYASLPEHFRIAAVCDVDEARASALAAEFNIPLVMTDLAQLCRRDDLDVIDLCTPSHLHAGQILQVLASGKHVVCEKPVAGSLKQIDELMAAEAQSARWVMPIFQYRFGRGLQQLKLLVEAGVAGKATLTTVETAWRRRADYYTTWRGKWATEMGGALLTLAIHAHDALYYILGPAASVYARCATLVNPIETEDTVSASLQMADGSLCSLSVTTGSAQEISRQRFCFANLTAESNTRPYDNSSQPWSYTPDSPEAAERMAQVLANFQPLPEGYVGQFVRFHRALTRGTPLPVTLADARASLELITAAYESSLRDQPVALPLGPEHPLYNGWQPLDKAI